MQRPVDDELKRGGGLPRPEVPDMSVTLSARNPATDEHIEAGYAGSESSFPRAHLARFDDVARCIAGKHLHPASADHML